MTDGQTEACEANGPWPIASELETKRNETTWNAKERKSMWTTFDIETAPLTDTELQAICPKFSEKSVKFGRTTDPEKRRKIAEKARESHFDDFKDKAALCPSTGRVLVVATCTAHSGGVSFIEGDECDVLSTWWEVAREHKKAQWRMAGVNIYDFDLPFLIRRSWILGVLVPSFAIDLASKWMNFDPMFVDLRLCWQCGNRQATSNFDHIGRALGTGGKTAGDHGKQFAEVYAKDRKTALEYAANDVRQPAAWLYKMGLVSGQIPDELNPPIDAEFTVTEEKESVADDHEPTLDNI